ncbi:hypothetical protein HC823_02005 [Candidatus Gracilibacteria bacterium]|nr:hypothetical protein [Candidatus Gracilibacteria bacterium]
MCLRPNEIESELGGSISIDGNEVRAVFDTGNAKDMAKKILNWGKKNNWKLRIKQLIAGGDPLDIQDEDLEAELYSA